MLTITFTQFLAGSAMAILAAASISRYTVVAMVFVIILFGGIAKHFGIII